MDERQLGELIGKVNAIKENTDRIPNMATSLALHDARLSALEPKVERHETMTQRAIGISAIFGILAGVLTSIFRNSGH